MKTIQEIERRYLVKAIDPDIQRESYKRISQGYFDTPPHFSLRVRITDGAEAELTKKLGSGIERQEITHNVDLETGKFLLGACSDTLQKTRYFRDGWEIDFFHGPLAGLVIAEFEMTDRGQRLLMPPWISDAIEVTESLTNRHLARLAHDLADAKQDRPVRELLPKRIPHIVLTGGPCSGKSSVMRELQQEFSGSIHCVPEVATIVIAQVGVKPPVGDPMGMRKFQRTIYRVQRGFETISDLQAVRDGKSALLLDRGTIDGAAYMDGGIEELERVCRTSCDHEYGQYDLVICLETPPEKVYKDNRRNNPARHEDFEQASKLGKRIKKVWRSHPHFRFIPNCGSWQLKADLVKRTIREFLSPK
jgi:CYTH domain-containing protein/predicted ATPase